MAGYQKTVVVHAPVEKVFDYLNDPNKLLEYWPGFVEVSDVRPLENGGTCFAYVYRFAGIRLEGNSEDVEIVPLRRMVSKSTGGVESTVTWEVEPVKDGTRVVFTQDYRIPMPMLGKFAENMVVRLAERDGEVIMENMKAILEGKEG